MSKISFNIFLIFIFVSNQLSAQRIKLKRGENLYKTYSYSESIQKYEAVEIKTTEINRRLAESYFNTGKFIKAEEYYRTVVFANDKTANDIYRYASVLAINKKYHESEQWMLEFNKLNENDSRGQLWAKNSGFYEKLQRDRGRFKIENLHINTDQEDFGTAYYKDKIVFASTRQPVEMIKRRWNWNELPFLDIYLAEPDTNLHFTSIQKFHNKINKKFHEGPASFSKDGEFMAFTRNDYKGKSSEGIIKLQLFTAEFKDNKWQRPVSMTFNSSEYSVGHGSLTADGKTMYFASDMPGGFGGVDLYKINKKEDGRWTVPENLGKTINTEGNEMFPFIHPDSMLFFSSDGMLGLGGLDVYMSKLLPGGFEVPQNIGIPVNSSYDDFAFILNDKQESGYFSSNRPEGEGDDDIYLFRMLKAFRFNKLIRGTAMDLDSNILSNVKVNLYSQDNLVLGTIITEKDGKYEFDAEQDKIYQLDGVKVRYTNGYNTADTHTDEEIVIADLFLDIKPQFSLYCEITDEGSGDPLDSVKVTMKDNLNNQVEEIITPITGDFRRNLPNKRLNDSLSYHITLEKDGYLSKNLDYNQLMFYEGQYNMHESLGFTMERIEVGIDLSDIIDINPIYFDLNKANIRPDAAIELDKIVKLMIENPNIVIELGAHTDCRGSKTYNLDLSDRRAKASANYIKSRITNPERIDGKGYGESKLKNHCECEGSIKAPCTEEEHQQNRRTEFILMKM